jgi:ATP/maltotriose-dependent transcriptional regulator MalT/DNA-binding SARP family transcriptional activator
MFGDDIVVYTRLMPPRLPRRWLRRPRLDRLLSNAVEYPVTVVSASAGYGKSSALASFAARGGWPVMWYSMGEGVSDPLVFLLHLVHACRGLAPAAGARTIALLEQHSQGPQAWSQALDALINDLTRLLDDETILVLDDYHVVDDLADICALIERLISQSPPQLHVLIASRRWPQLAALPILQARGELFVVLEAELAFTEEEVATLFEADDDDQSSVSKAAQVSEQTRGWPIALQLIWQGAQKPASDDRRPTAEVGTDTPQWPAVAAQLSSHHDVLFTYLAHEVLAGQPAEIQSFLLRSSVLAELDPATCDRVLGATDSGEWLRGLYRRGLFLTAIGVDQYRYHPLFHAFLQQRARATLPEWADLHTRSAAYYREIGAGERVLYHLMAVSDTAGIAAELERLAQSWIDEGRFVTLIDWLDQLPPEVVLAHPQLLIARGDAERLLARFEQALASYAEAERHYATRGDPIGQSRALKGQAQIYLDTVRPAPATALLRHAYKLLPRDLAQQGQRIALLRRIAENRLNAGRPDQAMRLYRLAERVSGQPQTDARVFLRLGQLNQARALLERQLRHDRAAAYARSPEAHREPTLLLSLICGLLGDPAAALGYAQEGLASARQLGSALSEAVAHIRLGHALQLQSPPDYATANSHYLQAMAQADAFTVQRTKAAAYLGLALLHGFNGDLDAARAAAREGLTIVERTGDQWTAARLWTALGAVGAASGAPEAGAWLDGAWQRHLACKDAYSQAAVQLSMAIWHQRAGRLDKAEQHARETLRRAQRGGYTGLLIRPTLFGPRDRMALVPVLLAGRGDPELRPWAQELLAQGFPAIAADEATQAYHPGCTLRIQVLERLRVWRGSDEVDPRAWQRKKAQQMLALLLTNRHRWLLREQICDWLWSEESEADAETQFKVTLNALNAVLEPLRPPRTPPFYIRRQGGAYRFCPPDGVWIDVADFEARLDAARKRIAAGGAESAEAHEQLALALSLYQGDYLGDYLYEDWTREERDRLANRYLEAATLLAELLFKRGQLADTIRFCEGILARDPCWEDAYRLLMRAYARQGNRRQAMATYDRCVRNLRAQLDVAPLPQTTQVYEELKL